MGKAIFLAGTAKGGSPIGIPEYQSMEIRLLSISSRAHAPSRGRTWEKKPHVFALLLSPVAPIIRL
jgi:hypothetical protein